MFKKRLIPHSDVQKETYISVKFQILTTTTKKMTVFWHAAIRPEDGGSKHLPKVVFKFYQTIQGAAFQRTDIFLFFSLIFVTFF
jgi:hypothetical protein